MGSKRWEEKPAKKPGRYMGVGAPASPKGSGAGWRACAAALLGFAAESHPASPQQRQRRGHVKARQNHWESPEARVTGGDSNRLVHRERQRWREAESVA